MSFTYAKCYTAGLIAFGANGSTDHYASRPEVQAALRHAETNRGWAPLAGMTVHEDNLRLLLSELGNVKNNPLVLDRPPGYYAWRRGES